MKAFVRGQAAGGRRQATGDPLPPTASPTGASPPRAPHVRGRLPPSSVAVALVAGLAAILVAPTISLSPTMLDDIAVYAFAAAVWGGFGSLAGAIVGGFVIGVVNSLIGAYLSTNYQLSLVFLLIVVILYVRPQGLFGVEATTRQ